MNILPWILYFLKVVPVPLPKYFFLDICSLYVVWSGKKPRLAMGVLKWSKQKGGLGIPDVFGYYRVVALQCILNWRFHASAKLWVSLEKPRVGRNLSCAPWVPLSDKDFSEWVSSLTVHTFGKCGADWTGPITAPPPSRVSTGASGRLSVVPPWGSLVLFRNLGAGQGL